MCITKGVGQGAAAHAATNYNEVESLHSRRGYRLQVTGYRLQVTGYRLRVTSCGLWALRSRIVLVSICYCLLAFLSWDRRIYKRKHKRNQNHTSHVVPLAWPPRRITPSCAR